MRTKTFDCVRMKRQGAEQVMKELEGKSLREQLDYWQKGTEDLNPHISSGSVNPADGRSHDRM